LKEALVAAAEKRLDAAVADGKLTEAQAKELLARYKELVDDVVERTFDGHGFGFGGPPGMHGFGRPAWRSQGFGSPGALAPALGAPA
jgi:hypothetical protein